MKGDTFIELKELASVIISSYQSQKKNQMLVYKVNHFTIVICKLSIIMRIELKLIRRVLEKDNLMRLLT
jgi:hypothetical protein